MKNDDIQLKNYKNLYVKNLLNKSAYLKMQKLGKTVKVVNF